MTKKTSQNPIQIIGAGPTGLSLAIALADRDISCVIHETLSKEEALNNPRTLALSYGTSLKFQSLGIGSQLLQDATPIKTVHTSRLGHFGQMTMKASVQKVPALGYVISSKDLLAALLKKVHTHHIQINYQSKFTPNQNLSTQDLVVWANGHIPHKNASIHDYHQTAILCEASPATFQQYSAWERFVPNGIIAALPFHSKLTLIYCCQNEHLKSLMALSDSEYLKKISSAFSEKITFDCSQSLSPRKTYPLLLKTRHHQAKNRQVWIGNASQTIHPVGGQGFNLALRDAIDLADMIYQSSDPGCESMLKQYNQSRQPDRKTTAFLTHILGKISTDPSFKAWPASLLFSTGLLLTDNIPLIKRGLINKMMLKMR